MKKSERHFLLRKLVEDNIVLKQEDLLVLLSEQGVNITQATISRDIQELGMIKAYDDQGNIRYMCEGDKTEGVSEISLLEELFIDLVVDITMIQFVIVIKTTLGNANVVAAEFDALDFSEVSGTLAGADTIVLFAKSNEDAKLIFDQLKSYMKD